MTWHHAPRHWSFEAGIYMVTAGTYNRLPHLATPERRDHFQSRLLEIAADFGWKLHAWSILPNHYHFLAATPENPATLPRMLGKLHMQSARELNLCDNTPGRKVWYQYWESQISYERSYLARLNYVHNNAVKHGLATVAEEYPWSSAAAFAAHAPAAFVRTVKNFKTDRLLLPDEY